MKAHFRFLFSPPLTSFPFFFLCLSFASFAAPLTGRLGQLSLAVFAWMGTIRTAGDDGHAREETRVLSNNTEFCQE